MAYQTVNPANNQLINQYAGDSAGDVEGSVREAERTGHSLGGHPNPANDRQLKTGHRGAAGTGVQ